MGRSRVAPGAGGTKKLHSSVVYLRLLPDPEHPDLLGAVERTFFLRQKASTEILQQPAFSPNGLFLAAPQNRRVDILTNGRTAQPFFAVHRRRSGAVYAGRRGAATKVRGCPVLCGVAAGQCDHRDRLYHGPCAFCSAALVIRTLLVFFPFQY